MAINVPMPGLPFAGLNQSIATGGNLFQQMMHPVLERERQKQLEEHFKQEMALRKASEARMGANSSLNRQLLQQQIISAQHANDPKWALQQLQAKLDYIQNMGRQGQDGQQPKSPANLRDMMVGQDQNNEMPEGQMPSSNNIDPSSIPQAVEQAKGMPSGLNMDEVKKALTYQALGLKQPSNGIYKEPPEIKRQNDLRAKMEEAKFKHEIKIDEERTKNELKNEATRQKVIDSARNDLPHLKETLRSLEIMKKIADDPKNSDMFGHWWLGHDKAAQRATNPNAGTWQVHGLGPIIDAEMKMSSRGNQLALKSALNNKANFGEDRSVAASKLDASIDQIQRRINETKKIVGIGNESNSVIVIDPNGKKFETTAENAAHLPEGWKHG